MGILVLTLTLLARSGGRTWRPVLLVALGCLLSWFLLPAIHDFGWIGTVLDLRVMIPGTIGCLGLVCIGLGLAVDVSVSPSALDGRGKECLRRQNREGAREQRRKRYCLRYNRGLPSIAIVG